jgi:hypothetical protein
VYFSLNHLFNYNPPSESKYEWEEVLFVEFSSIKLAASLFVLGAREMKSLEKVDKLLASSIFDYK